MPPDIRWTEFLFDQAGQSYKPYRFEHVEQHETCAHSRPCPRRTSTHSQVSERGSLMAIMRDGASVSGTAMRVFRALYPSFIDITCFAHTIDRVGVYFELSTLDRFMNWWAQLFNRSFAAKFCWKQQTGISMKHNCQQGGEASGS